MPIDGESVANNVERFLIAGRSKRAWRVRLLLTLFEFLPISATGQRFTQLSPEAQRRLIEERFVSPRATGPSDELWWMCSKLRVLVMMGAYGDPRAEAPTGYVAASDRSRLRVVVDRYEAAS